MSFCRTLSTLLKGGCDLKRSRIPNRSVRGAAKSMASTWHVQAEQARTSRLQLQLTCFSQLQNSTGSLHHCLTQNVFRAVFMTRACVCVCVCVTRKCLCVYGRRRSSLSEGVRILRRSTQRDSESVRVGESMRWRAGGGGAWRWACACARMMVRVRFSIG